jgi:hypothetical protein
MTKPKMGTYQIRVRGEGDTFTHPVHVAEIVRGYVSGIFGCRKSRYSYDFTHIPTGLAINVGWYTKKDQALARLADLGVGGLDALPSHIAAALREVESL